jgi:hypothetical protein
MTTRPGALFVFRNKLREEFSQAGHMAIIHWRCPGSPAKARVEDFPLKNSPGTGFSICVGCGRRGEEYISTGPWFEVEDSRARLRKSAFEK